MSVRDCLIEMFADDKQISLRIEKTPDDQLKDLVQGLHKSAQEDLRSSQLHSLKMMDSMARMDEYKRPTFLQRGEGEVADPEHFLEAELRGEGNSLENEVEYIVNQAHADVGDSMEDFRPATVNKGVKDSWMGRSSERALQEETIIAHLGGKSDNPRAVQASKGFAKALESLRVQANKAGLPIDKIENYLPAFHDSIKIKDMGPGPWKAAVKKHFDMEALNRLNNKPADADPDEILDIMFETLSTEGLNKQVPEAFQVKDRLGIKGQKQRYLYPKSGEDYIAYQKIAGKDDFFSALTGHIEGMARTIATARKFGPYPDRAFDALMDQVKLKTGKAPSEKLRNMYNDLTGNLYAEETTLGNVMNGLRAVMTGTKLPFASISAGSDVIYSMRAAAFNNMKPLKTLAGYIQRLAPTRNKSDRIWANRHLLGAEYAISSMRVMSRFSDVTGNGWATRYADSVLRLSGLNYMTKTAKMNFQMEMLSNIPQLKGKKLSPDFKAQLERYNISDRDWDTLMESKWDTHNGVPFIDPTVLEPELARKVVGMTRQETRYAVPEADAGTRAYIHMGTKRNTLSGEMIRSLMQFKPFGVSVILSQGHRALYQHTGGGALKYFGTTAAMATAMGYLVLTTKDALKGKTPRDLTTPQTYTDAFIQGGVLGIVGDFVVGTPKYGISRAVMGPLLSDMDLTARFVFGSKKDVDDVESYLYDRGSRLFATTTRATVGGLWQTRLVVDRMLNDGAESFGDPNWQKKQMRTQKKIKEDYGQEMWWGPK